VGPLRASSTIALGRRGAATVEHLALSLLVALLAAGAIAALSAGPSDAGRELGFALARRLRCAAQGPGPCWQDPLTLAYGRSLAGAVRALSPRPRAVPDPGGTPLLAVDFRTCRSASCATPGAKHGLTASNRRVSAFTHVRELAGETVISYWEYRPGIGWAEIVARPDPAELAALARTPLLDDQVPALVPLETLAGANHIRFTAREEPPWRWQVARR
jgi:hypothetical protein